ncbi:hypothetical protein ASA1KI_21540 [Opitutales bacterium ASA1]|uniref:hypothetical protein n=1 Tax=Congregicoccus parvus TaxID=3081749 RepID=UPI002B296295|nr:hypothetical protein ASA1KI_21540 [Opitutales bacterium ASA1]
MRDHALNIIERQILPLGEIATLNVLPVLHTAIRTFYATMGGRFDERTKRLWQPERLKALAVLDLIANDSSDRVRWKTRTHIRHLLCSEHPRSRLHQAAAESLALLPFTGGLRETAIFCSHGWDELDDDTPGRPKRAAKEQKDDVNKGWAEANDVVARDLIARFPEGPQLLRALERIYIDCQRVGFSPNPFALFNAIGRRDAKLGKSVIAYLIRRRVSPIHYWWPHFVAATIRFPDEWLERTCVRILAANSPTAIFSLLTFLGSAVAGPVPTILLRSLSRWSKSAHGQMADGAIRFIRHARSGDDPVWLAVAPHLNLRRLSSDQLIAAGVSVHCAVKYSKINVSDRFLIALVSEMQRVPDLKCDHGYDFLALMGDRVPRAVFDLYYRRILRSERGEGQSFHAVPMDPHPLKELPKTKGYAQLVRSLFKTIRARPRNRRWAWNRLLQSAVVEVSPLALPELKAWVRSARSLDELEGISALLSFEGSLYLLHYPELALALLRRGREVDPAKYPEWEARLASTMGPKIHSFTNGKRDPEQDYVTAEANKLAAAENLPPELQSFVAAVIRHDQSWTYGRTTTLDDED